MVTNSHIRLQSDLLERDKLAWLLGTQVVVILPLLVHLPFWLWLVWASSALWRTQMFRGRWSAPKKMIKTFLTLFCATGIYLSYGGATGTETMVALLVCAFVLKLLEVYRTRDAQLLIFIGFVITATQALFSQTPFAALHMLSCCIALVTSWRALYLTRQQTLTYKLRRGTAIVFHSIPVMLALFLVLPRISPLWAVPNQQAAKTGFSDTLSPGDLGELALSHETAFRVEFSGPTPPATSLYWRGLVMDHFDGRSWHLRESWARDTSGSKAIERAVKHERVEYSIIIEAHGQPWLFSLMTPVSAETSNNLINISSESLLTAPYPLAQRLRYEVSSALVMEWPEPPRLRQWERNINLQLPPQLNPKTRVLAQAWVDQGLTQADIVEQALQLFNEAFVYTLQPPPLGQHSVDEFLFQTKRGFCEHFASSFAFLMRAAKIPARIVVGYQGGRWNQVENYLLVSQADAHAWTEIWVEGEGWRTIDPTGAVAPERIEQGINQALNSDDQNLISRSWETSPFLRHLQQRWDAAGFAWQRWVLSYDNETQKNVLTDWLGGSESWRIALWLLSLGLIGVGIFAWTLLRRQRSYSARPENAALKRLEKKLAPLGHQRKPSETVAQFCQRVSISHPEYRLYLEPIAALFAEIAYANQPHQLEALCYAIEQFPRSKLGK